MRERERERERYCDIIHRRPFCWLACTIHRHVNYWPPWNYDEARLRRLLISTIAAAWSHQSGFADPLPLAQPGIPIFMASPYDKEVRALLPEIQIIGFADVLDGWPQVPPSHSIAYNGRGAITWEICRQAGWVLGSSHSSFDANFRINALPHRSMSGVACLHRPRLYLMTPAGTGSNHDRHRAITVDQICDVLGPPGPSSLTTRQSLEHQLAVGSQH